MGAGNDIDFSAGNMFYKTLTANTILTASGLVKGKTIKLVVEGDFSVTWFSGIVAAEVTGYSPIKENVYYITCVDTITPIFSTLFSSSYIEYTSPSVIAISTATAGATLSLPSVLIGDLILILSGDGSSFATDYINVPAGYIEVNNSRGSYNSTRFSFLMAAYKISDGTETSTNHIFRGIGAAVIIRGANGVSAAALGTIPGVNSSSPPLAIGSTNDLGFTVTAAYLANLTLDAGSNWGILASIADALLCDVIYPSGSGEVSTIRGANASYGLQHLSVRVN